MRVRAEFDSANMWLIRLVVASDLIGIERTLISFLYSRRGLDENYCIHLTHFLVPEKDPHLSR